MTQSRLLVFTNIRISL